MIKIKKEVMDKIIDYAKRALPNEACGYLAAYNGVITHCYNLTNIDQSPEHFSFDPTEQFQTLKDARNKGIEIVANYHSHPETPARPSNEDIRLAYDSDIDYFIISLLGNIPDVKAYSLKNLMVEKKEIEIIED